jgi:hypothetical protein
VWTGLDTEAPNGRFVDFTYQDNSGKSRFISLNGCGLGSIKSSNGAGSISVNGGTATAIGNIPIKQGGLRCSLAQVLGADGDFTLPTLATVFKDTENNIFFKTTAGASILVGLDSQASTKSVTSDRCGGLTIGSQLSPQTTPFTLNGATIDPSSLSVGLKPNCKLTGGSYAYDVVPSGNFKTSSGQVFVKNDSTYPTGFGDRRILQITTTGTGSKSLTANACGLATIRSTTSSPIIGSTAFTYAGSSYTVADLPVDKATCANTGTSASPSYQLFRALN